MKRILRGALAIFLFVALAGCGGGNGASSSPRQVTAQIISDAALDGYIAQAPLSGAFTVTQGNTQSVFTGTDPVAGAEIRAFLDFHLSGAGGVPVDAVIDSAILDIFINSIQPPQLTGTIPIRLDMVSFDPATMTGTDFSRTAQPALVTSTIIPPISADDFGQHISLDVTSFMKEAQRLALSNMQIRILQDSASGTPGMIEINDTTGANRRLLAPLLQVTYF